MALPHLDLTPAELDELLSAVLPDVPGYRVLRLLGRGGMSYVYLGIQEQLDRQVAIKVVSPLAQEDEVGKQRFEKEARIIAKLQHPGIVAIHAVGRTDDGLLYYVMPYLSRGHLGKRDLRNDEVRIISVLRSLLTALDYAHAQGVVHRDVKPANVLFDHNDRPLLTDFGIAITKLDHSRMTSHGNAVGSWAYMSPEQARGEHVDGQADIYSVGVLTYELLCGRLPFHDKDSMALALMHALDPVPRLPSDKAHWQELIDCAMAKAPAQRYASAHDMLTALDRIALQPRQRATVPWRQWIDRFAQSARQRAGLLAGGVALLTLLILGVSLWPDTPPSPRVDTATIAAVAPSPPIEPRAPVRDPLPALTQAPHEADAPEVLSDADADADTAPALPPGEAALLNAEEQIHRRRLTQPAGDSALDSLIDARTHLGNDARLTAAGKRWLAALLPYVVAALERGDDDTALALRDSANRLDLAVSLSASPGWEALQTAIVAPLQRQLRAALDTRDIVALRAAKQRAERLGVAPEQLEPEYSRAIITAKVGDLMPAGNTTAVLVRLPTRSQLGVAMMPTAVTQADYARFAKASGREASTCRNRAALVSLKTRTWQSPGFAQTAEHPVVCVTLADAHAYAAWLSQRDHVTYRLPTADEWRSATGAPTQPACGRDGVICKTGGTVTAQPGARQANGVYSLIGNVREWSAGCRECRDHPTLGLGWRDASSNHKEAEINPRRAYDDVGFRLVRDVPLTAVEQR